MVCGFAGRVGEIGALNDMKRGRRIAARPALAEGRQGRAQLGSQLRGRRRVASDSSDLDRASARARDASKAQVVVNKKRNLRCLLHGDSQSEHLLSEMVGDSRSVLEDTPRTLGDLERGVSDRVRYKENHN